MNFNDELPRSTHQWTKLILDMVKFTILYLTDERSAKIGSVQYLPK